MKDILLQYLNKEIRVKYKFGIEHKYILFKVSDNYFGIKLIANPNINRYVPYTSIFEINEQNGGITIDLYKSGGIIRKLDKTEKKLETMENYLDTLKTDLSNTNDELKKSLLVLQDIMDFLNS